MPKVPFGATHKAQSMKEMEDFPMRVFPDIDALRRAVGQELGVSDWITVDQDMINRFAEATGDFQWIHVDVARAKASPLGTTIAHGFLTLSLLARLSQEAYRVEKLTNRLNYGCNRVRFMTPVPANSRIRGRFKAVSLESVPQGVRLTTESTVELEGSVKPACVAEQLSVLIPA
jgi:acyl dehydratase